jgi:acylphosphatase
MDGNVAFRALVSGRVQGVFFRDATRRRAQELRLMGWVRNLPDGRVEVHAVGDPAACESLLQFLRVGPPRAEVTGVDVQWISADETPRAFEIR